MREADVGAEAGAPQLDTLHEHARAEEFMPPWPRRPLRLLGIREPTDGQTRTTGPSYLKARRRPTTTRNFEWSSLPPSFLGDIISEDPILAEHFGLFNFARGELPRKQRRRGGRKIRATVAAAAHYHVGRSFSKTAAEVAIKNVSWPPARPSARQQ